MVGSDGCSPIGISLDDSGPGCLWGDCALLNQLHLATLLVLQDDGPIFLAFPNLHNSQCLDFSASFDFYCLHCSLPERRTDIIQVIEGLFGFRTRRNLLFVKHSSLRAFWFLHLLELGMEYFLHPLDSDCLSFAAVCSPDHKPNAECSDKDDEDVLFFGDEGNVHYLNIIFCEGLRSDSL